MANDFFKYLSGNENEIDLVLPVPIHRKKKRKRGYNQAELIAKGIVGQLGVDMVTDVLVSQKGKRSQTGIGRYGRWLNVGSVFGLRYEHKLKGKHVLVVDDVVTTGATLLRCIDLLKEIEGIRISVYTLAFADRL